MTASHASQEHNNDDIPCLRSIEALVDRVRAGERLQFPSIISLRDSLGCETTHNLLKALRYVEQHHGLRVLYSDSGIEVVIEEDLALD